MKVTYLERGQEFNFRRIDTKKTVFLQKTWRSGSLLYGYRDRFNIIAISIEDIISIDE